jgi:hypothetical protein
MLPFYSKTRKEKRKISVLKNLSLYSTKYVILTY